MGTELLTRRMDLIHTQSGYYVDRLQMDTSYPVKLSGIIVKVFKASNSYKDSVGGGIDHKFEILGTNINEGGSLPNQINIPLENTYDFEGKRFKSNGFIKGDYVLSIIDVDNKLIYLDSLHNANRSYVASNDKYKRELNYHCNGKNDNVILQEIVNELLSLYDENKDIDESNQEYDLIISAQEKLDIFTNGKFTINLIGKFGIDYSQTKFTYGGFNRQNRSSIMTISGNTSRSSITNDEDLDMELILNWENCYVPEIAYDSNEKCAALYNTMLSTRTTHGDIIYRDYWTKLNSAHFKDEDGTPYGNLFPRRLVFASIEGNLPINITFKNLSLTTFGVGIYCETESNKTIKLIDSKISILNNMNYGDRNFNNIPRNTDVFNDQNFYKNMFVPMGSAIDINAFNPSVEIINCKIKNASGNRDSNLIINSCGNMKILNSTIKDFNDYSDGYKDAYTMPCMDFEYFYDFDFTETKNHTYNINGANSIEVKSYDGISDKTVNPNMLEIMIMFSMFYGDSNYHTRVPNKLMLNINSDGAYYDANDFSYLNFSDLSRYYELKTVKSNDKYYVNNIYGSYFSIKSRYTNITRYNTSGCIKNIPVLYNKTNGWGKSIENNDNGDVYLSEYSNNIKNISYGNKDSEYMPRLLIESSTIRAAGILYQYNAITNISNTKIHSYQFDYDYIDGQSTYSSNQINLIGGELTLNNCDCDYDTRIRPYYGYPTIRPGEMKFDPSFIKVFPVLCSIKDDVNNTSSNISYHQLTSPAVTILNSPKLNINNTRIILYSDIKYNIPSSIHCLGIDNEKTKASTFRKINGTISYCDFSSTVRFISTFSDNNANNYYETINKTRSFFNPITAPIININNSEFLVDSSPVSDFTGPNRYMENYTDDDTTLCTIFRVDNPSSSGITTSNYKDYNSYFNSNRTLKSGVVKHDLKICDLPHTGYYLYNNIMDIIHNKDQSYRGSKIINLINTKLNNFGVVAFKIENAIFNMDNCKIGGFTGSSMRNTYGLESFVKRSPRICFDFGGMGIYKVTNTSATAWGTVLWSTINNSAYSRYKNDLFGVSAPFDSSTLEMSNKGMLKITNCDFMNYSALRFYSQSEDWDNYLGVTDKSIVEKPFINDKNSYNESIRNSNEMPIMFIANNHCVESQINSSRIMGNETVIISGNVSFNNDTLINNNNAMICYIDKYGNTLKSYNNIAPKVYINNCDITATKDVINDVYINHDTFEDDNCSNKGMDKYNNIVTAFYIESNESYLELNGNNIRYRCNAYDSKYGIDSNSKIRLVYYNKYYNEANYNQYINFINNTVSMLFDCPFGVNKSKILPDSENMSVIELNGVFNSYQCNANIVNITNNIFNIFICLLYNSHYYINASGNLTHPSFITKIGSFKSILKLNDNKNILLELHDYEDKDICSESIDTTFDDLPVDKSKSNKNLTSLTNPFDVKEGTSNNIKYKIYHDYNDILYYYNIFKIPILYSSAFVSANIADNIINNIKSFDDIYNISNKQEIEMTIVSPCIIMDFYNNNHKQINYTKAIPKINIKNNVLNNNKGFIMEFGSSDFDKWSESVTNDIIAGGGSSVITIKNANSYTNKISVSSNNDNYNVRLQTGDYKKIHNIVSLNSYDDTPISKIMINSNITGYIYKPNSDYYNYGYDKLRWYNKTIDKITFDVSDFVFTSNNTVYFGNDYEKGGTISEYADPKIHDYSNDYYLFKDYHKNKDNYNNTGMCIFFKINSIHVTEGVTYSASDLYINIYNYRNCLVGKSGNNNIYFNFPKVEFIWPDGRDMTFKQINIKDNVLYITYTNDKNEDEEINMKTEHIKNIDWFNSCVYNNNKIDSYATYFILLVSNNKYGSITNSEKYINVDGYCGIIYTGLNDVNANKIDLTDLYEFIVPTDRYNKIYFKINYNKLCSLYSDFTGLRLACIAIKQTNSDNIMVIPITNNNHLAISNSSVSKSNNPNGNDYLVEKVISESDIVEFNDKITKESEKNTIIYTKVGDNKLIPVDRKQPIDVEVKQIALNKNKIYDLKQDSIVSVNDSIDITSLKLKYKGNDNQYIKIKDNNIDSVLFIPDKGWYDNYVKYSTSNSPINTELDYLHPTILNSGTEDIYLINSTDDYELETNFIKSRLKENNVIINLNNDISLLDNNNSWSIGGVFLSYLFDLLGDIYGNITQSI